MKEKTAEAVQRMIDESLDRMYHRAPGTTTNKRLLDSLENRLIQVEKAVKFLYTLNARAYLDKVRNLQQS